MTKREAIEILEEVKTLDDSMFTYSQAYNDALDTAIEALKAQEPVRPVTGLWDRDIQLFNCGACGGEIGAGGIAKYCFHCGRAVKWE